MIKKIAIIISSSIFLSSIFELQYSILIGPFLDFVLLFVLILIGLTFSIITIAIDRNKNKLSYLPLIMIVAAFGISLIMRNFSFGHYFHYLLNVNKLALIDSESKKANIYEMTDMLRHHKKLNEASVSNDLSYTEKQEILNLFNEYIHKEGLDVDKIIKIQESMIDSDIISLHRTDDYLVLTIDGFVDNEYGYIKSYSKELKIGDTIPPYEFRIVRLMDWGNGWYFFYST